MEGADLREEQRYVGVGRKPYQVIWYVFSGFVNGFCNNTHAFDHFPQHFICDGFYQSILLQVAELWVGLSEI